MNRITKKYDDGSYGISECTCEVEKKLGQIEDIEQELGIDLVTLFKALKDGANFSKQNETVMGIPFAHIVNSPKLVYDYFGQKWVLRAKGDYERKVEDFGITWSLLERS